VILKENNSCEKFHILPVVEMLLMSLFRKSRGEGGYDNEHILYVGFFGSGVNDFSCEAQEISKKNEEVIYENS
jgi:hypothetical protein